MCIDSSFPFHGVFSAFIEAYSDCRTYWYVPTARAINDDNVQFIRSVVEVIYADFADARWTREVQDQLLEVLVDRGLVAPYVSDATLGDRTALPRIIRRLCTTLGLLWVEESSQLTLTDAGLALIESGNSRRVIERQIRRYQFPHPGQNAGHYPDDFGGLLPHLFLLQVLVRVEFILTIPEYDLFLNLAQSHDDLEDTVRYITHWRQLSEQERNDLLSVVQVIPLAGNGNERYARIGQNSPYQRSFHTYPSYLSRDDGGISCEEEGAVQAMVDSFEDSLAVPSFSSREDWFYYFGDPNRQPSWYTVIQEELARSDTADEAEAVLDAHDEVLESLTAVEREEVQHLYIERRIEAFYASEEGLSLLDPDLTLVQRQYPTPIGRMDLLCQASDGTYVVIEIKRDEARDRAIGQILRYIGWIHANLPEGRDNVRGIILASSFPEGARYSRIGLPTDAPEDFLQFMQHGLDVEEL